MSGQQQSDHRQYLDQLAERLAVAADLLLPLARRALPLCRPACHFTLWQKRNISVDFGWSG
jgi:hypothetical protein